MTDFSKLSKEELNKMDKNVLITIIGVLQMSIPAPIEPPVRSLRATIPAA